MSFTDRGEWRSKTPGKPVYFGLEIAILDHGGQPFVLRLNDSVGCVLNVPETETAAIITLAHLRQRLGYARLSARSASAPRLARLRNLSRRLASAVSSSRKRSARARSILP